MAKETQEAAPAPTEAVPRTRLLNPAAVRQDDARLLALIRDVPVAGSGCCDLFRMGLLNEAGELYREVLLRGEYEAVLFMARMNACGFVRQAPGAPLRAEGFDSLFARPAAVDARGDVHAHVPA